MAITTGSEDAWQRQAFISVENSSTVKLQYESVSETIDIDTGEREFDVINLLNLGQIPKHGSAGICTITFEGYPLQAGTADTSGSTRGTPSGGVGTGFFDVFANVQNLVSSGELDVDVSNTLTRYRIAILWTDDADLTGTMSAANDGAASITGTSTTTLEQSGKMLEVTSGTGNGGQYMIVSNDGTSVYTLTTGDTPETDLGTTTPNNTYTIHPTGSGAVMTAAKGSRVVLADCICVSCKTSFTDGIKKQTLVFKGRMFSSTGAPLYKEESNTTSEKLTALGNYTAGATYWA